MPPLARVIMAEPVAEICAVLAAADPDGLYVLTLAGRQKGQGHMRTLPAAPFDPARGQSFEDRLRDWASVHTTAQITRIMQIGASTNRGRIRITLLALVSDRDAFMPRGARWTPIREIFPWESWQTGEPDSLARELRPALNEWASTGDKAQIHTRQARLDVLFAPKLAAWAPGLCAARFDTLYTAGLLPEALRDRSGAMVSVRRRHAAVYGQVMHGQDRRAIAQALSLMREQLAHAPLMPALLPSPFTLGVLQHTVEAMIGLPLHTQNFRRDLMRTGLVSQTGERGRIGKSRPGALWAWAPSASHGLAPLGMPLPRKTFG